MNVTHFVGGSISQFENDIKISVHLTSTNDGKDPWAEIYNRNFNNPFKVQQDVSQKIVAQLEVELTPEEEKTLRKYPTKNMEAYELFAKGRLLNNNQSKTDVDLSIDLFEQAIFLDPNFAEAYAEMAWSYFKIKNWRETDGMNKAKESIVKALNIDPQTARAYAIRGHIYAYELDWAVSKENFEIAIELDPNDVLIQQLYGHYFSKKPIPDQKKRLFHARIAHRIDPLDISMARDLILALMYNENLKEAEENLNKLGYLFGSRAKTKLEIDLEVFKNKDWTAAVSYLEREIEKEPNNIWAYLALSRAFDGILNDDVNSLKYAKKAYELDSTRYGSNDRYYITLLWAKKFTEAKKLSQTKSYGILSDYDRLNNLWSYYYHQENYKKAEEILNDSLVGLPHFFFNQLLTYAQLGDRKKIDKLINNYYIEYGRTEWINEDLAISYAILREKDSMYHYLEKLRPIDQFATFINNRGDFDPYRKEERYKALLKKHYLPITHWNE